MLTNKTNNILIFVLLLNSELIILKTKAVVSFTNNADRTL